MVTFACTPTDLGIYLEFSNEPLRTISSGTPSFATKAAELADREQLMTLQIVWRNPAAPPVTDREVKQIVADDHGAVYTVHSADETKVFELILHRAA